MTIEEQQQEDLRTALASQKEASVASHKEKARFRAVELAPKYKKVPQNGLQGLAQPYYYDQYSTAEEIIQEAEKIYQWLIKDLK